jgi:hypothetical protein
MQTFEGSAFSSYPYLLVTTSNGVIKVPLINQGSWIAGRDIALGQKTWQKT